MITAVTSSLTCFNALELPQCIQLIVINYNDNDDIITIQLFQRPGTAAAPQNMLLCVLYTIMTKHVIAILIMTNVIIII
jgi:hypothetical protein